MEKQDERSLLTLNWSQQGRKVVIFPLYIFASIADMIHFRMRTNMDRLLKYAGQQSVIRPLIWSGCTYRATT